MDFKRQQRPDGFWMILKENSHRVWMGETTPRSFLHWYVMESALLAPYSSALHQQWHHSNDTVLEDGEINYS